MNIALKTRIIERGFRQQDLCRLLDMDPGKLSRIIHGWIEPNEDTKAEIARYLGKAVGELFSEVKRASR